MISISSKMERENDVIFIFFPPKELLNLGICDLFGIWCLEFGISAVRL
jgi:hypothetical protein